MKNFIITSLLMIVLVGTWANSVMAHEGLTLTGTLAESGTGCFKDSNDLFIMLTVSLQARNDTERNLFFASPNKLFNIEIYDWSGVSEMIEKAPSIQPLKQYIYSRTPSKKLSDRESQTHVHIRESLLHTFSLPFRKAPPPSPFLTIASGGYHEFFDTFYLSPKPENVTKKNKLSDICKEPDPEKRVLPTLKDLGFTDGKFKVRYSFSAKDHKEYATALSDLKDRMEPFGYLPLTSGGDIVYTSEDIIFAP